MTNAKTRGVSVHLFLPQGFADGIRVAQIPGWTGCIACAPADAADHLADRPEANRAGLHIFIGSHPDGQGETVRMRIRSNLGVSVRGAFWESQMKDTSQVVVITDRDELLTMPQLHWIAHLLRGDFENVAGIQVLEDDIVSEIPIDEARRAQVECFMEPVRIVLKTLGII